ncbi:MAG: aminotransferase class I/II-fold pyridoxal phosphate-dependent enzyme, partial [Rhizobiales bacterium]|nr:aminotransferase class I/II-fold pyridoxal phosphate-dependent enzyme [Hyphomicrobiales bacterium]
GTVSKSLVPGLRVGWVVAEAGMIQNLALTKMASDLSGSLLTQAIALELMQRDFDHEHSSAIVPVYRERRDALLREAALRLSDWFEWEVPVGGMFVWMRSKDSAIDTDALYKFAVEEKVAYVPSSVFDFTGENRFAMRVNFTRSSPEVIAEGVRRLARAVEHYLSARQQLEGAA